MYMYLMGNCLILVSKLAMSLDVSMKDFISLSLPILELDIFISSLEDLCTQGMNQETLVYIKEFIFRQINYFQR